MSSQHESQELDYHVPSLQDDQNQTYSSSERCPRCGSHAILPSLASPLNDVRVPRSMQVQVCANCGQRYRINDAKALRPLRWYEVSLFVLIIVVVITLIIV